MLKLNPFGPFRDRSDIRPVTLVLLSFGTSFVPYFMQMGFWGLVITWVVMAYLRTFTAFAQHNHAHLSVFLSRPLNRVYDSILAACTGYTTAVWELHHVRGHHRDFLEPTKDVAGIVNPKTGEKISRVWYALRGNLLIHRDSIRIGIRERQKGRDSLLGKLAVDTGIQVAMLVVLMLINPWLTLAFFVAPAVGTCFAVWWVSHAHHPNTEAKSIYEASVSKLDAHFNFQTFNIGHHTAHHEKGTLHWSKLPIRTREIRAQIPDEMIRG